MAKQFPHIDARLADFISEQKVFFVGTAAAEGRINVSPKGMDSLRVIDQNTVVWMNLTGSGNETAAHLLKNPRMTIMFCAFEGKPLILRLYGKAKIFHKRDSVFQEYAPHFPTDAGARQIIVLDVDLVQTSCGFAVPLMDFREERSILSDWSSKKGEAGVEEYWDQKNRKSIDGFETGIFE